MMQGDENTVKYVLGIDGGGSKTLARLVNLQSKQQWQAQGGSSSLTNDLTGAITTITSLCQQVVSQAQIDYQNISAVFGLAGAGNEERVQQLIESLAKPFAQLTICSDARTSAYGANNGAAVAIVALGTGSVGMRLCDNGYSQLVGGWGFVAGDEGSGAKLGLAAVKATLYEFEQQGGFTSELTLQVSQVIGTNRPEMLTWLSAADPVDFAKLAPIVFAYALLCPLAKQLLERHLQAVEALITLTLADTKLPIVLLGGLAKVTQTYLAAKYQQQLSVPKGDALDGACLLAKQFYLNN
jgi:glucosamine kinase